MSEGTWKARILMEGFGRVNLPHFCARLKLPKTETLHPQSLAHRRTVLAPSHSFLLLILVGYWISTLSECSFSDRLDA